MSTQLKHHLEEWTVKSGIDPEIAKLNLESVQGREKIEEILGTYCGYETGWIARGINLKTMEQHEKFTQFKPDNPTIIKGEKKPRKYLTPKKEVTNYDAIALTMPKSDYWQLIVDDSTKPVVITEGIKKAAALLTCGFPTIALIGVDCGLLDSKLTDSLRTLATGEREFIFCFDYDDKPETVKNVSDALKRLAAPLLRAGHRISVAQWDNKLGKGIDDVLVAHGASEVKRIIVDALPYKKWTMPDQKFSDDAKPKKVIEAPKKEKKAKPNRFGEFGIDFSQLDLRCGTETFERVVLRKVFGDGDGDWRVSNHAFYQYQPTQGYFKHIDDESIEQIITWASTHAYTKVKIGDNYEERKPFTTEGKIRSAYKVIAKAIGIPERRFSNQKYIAFRNGSLNVETKQLEEHDRELFVTSYVDAEYKENAECPKVFRDFILSSYGEELLELVRALTNMFLDATAPYGKFAHLMGESGSGKGTLLRFWTELMGVRENGQADGAGGGLSFEAISTDEGRHQRLNTKRFYSMPDLNGMQKNIESFYELVDNGFLGGRPHFLNAYMRRWNVRFCIASVGPISIDHAGAGYNRRAIIVPAKPKGDRPEDPNLRDKLHAVRGEVISWAIAMDNTRRDEILMNAEKFAPAIRQAKRDQDFTSDPVKYFAHMALQPTAAESELSMQEVYAVYKQFCPAFGYLPLNFNNFAGRLYGALPESGKRNKKPRTVTKVNGNSVSIPACLIFLELRNGIIDSNSNFNRKACREGGLDEIAEFWQARSAVAEQQMPTIELKASVDDGNLTQSAFYNDYISLHKECIHKSDENVPLYIKVQNPLVENVDDCRNLTQSESQAFSPENGSIVGTSRHLLPAPSEALAVEVDYLVNEDEFEDY